MRKFIAPGILALAATALSAQGVDINGGLHTGLSLPVGDLYDMDGVGTNRFFGGHIGGHMDFNITPHHQVRAHLTYNRFPGSNWNGYLGSVDIKHDYTVFQGGADWVYNFQNPSSGWYTTVGASVNHFKDDYEYTITSLGSHASYSTSQSGRFGVRGGGGYNFNKRFSLEGTLNQVLADINGDIYGYGNGSNFVAWVGVSAVFRFGH